jgi:DNA uptake protein ComE-like DNA-binding protein
MSTLEEKKAALYASKSYHDENSDKIRFDANIPKTVIFPSDWAKHLSNLTREYDDENNPGQKKSVTYTVYKVYNPNAADAKKLRTIEASAKLDEQISQFLEAGLEQGWDGACIAKIKKIQKGSSKNVTWSVQGDKFDESKLEEVKQ